MEHTPILVHHSINHWVRWAAILRLNVKHLSADLYVGIESRAHAKAGPGLDPEWATVRASRATSVSPSGTPTSPPTACLRQRTGVRGVGNPPRQPADRAAPGLEYRPAASGGADRPPAP